MQLLFVLVFVLKMLSVQSQYWTQPGWGQPFRRVPIYCKCVPYYTCSEEVEAYRNNCHGFNEVCCQKLSNPSPQHRQQHPSQLFPNSPTRNPSSHQRPHGLSHISRQTPNRNPSPHRRPQFPSQISHQIPNRPQPSHHRQQGPAQTTPNTPNRNQSFQPKPQYASHTFPQDPLRNPSFQNRLHGTSEISPQTPKRNPSFQPSQQDPSHIFPQDPLRNPLFQNWSHGTSQITTNPQIREPSLQHWPQGTPQITSNTQNRNPSFQQWLQSTPNVFHLNPTLDTLQQTNLQDLPQTDSHAQAKNPLHHHRLQGQFQESPQIRPQKPSHVSSQTSIQNQPLQSQPPRPSGPSQIAIPQITRNPSLQHHPQHSYQTSSQIPTRSPSHNLQPTIPSLNPSLQPQSPSSSQISSKIPTRNQSQHHQPQSISQISTSNANCICTPFFRCYDEEISSNLTGLVDDRILTPFIIGRQMRCASPNEICCHNLVPPSLTQTRKPSQHPKPQGPSSISPQIATPNQSGQHQSPQIAAQISTNKQPQLPQPPRSSQFPPSQDGNCNCIPFRECYDEEIGSNLAALWDDQSNSSLRQGNCPDPNDVCCYNLVQPLTNPFSSLYLKPQPTFSSPIPIHTTIRNPTPKPPIHGQSLTFPQIPIRNPSAQPQPQVPAEISPNTNCICTPFFKCYDEETSSNLSTLVDDRSFIPSKQQGSCSDSNDVCCINLVKPSETLPTISSPDSRPQNPSQIHLQSTSNSRLPQARVSSTGGGNNPFGVIWPDK